MIFKKLKVEKVFHFLYLKPHNIYVRIYSNNYSFWYRSVDFDDLNMMCRENLKYWESSSREIFSILSRSANAVVDIGSYTGIYALVAVKSNAKLKVIAFEPNPDLFSALRQNIKINSVKNCAIEPFALDSEPGQAFLYLNHDVHTSIGSLIQSSSAGKKILVNKTTLDIYCENEKIENIDLMKIDAEGYELNILQGSKFIIGNSVPIILMESLSKESLASQYDFLSKLGYLEPIRVNGDGYDNNNWIWFAEKHRDKIKLIQHLLKH
jgi:FkbM family methyltransferase